MPFLDAILSVIAPHNCLGCGWEGELCCASCTESLDQNYIDRCYVCGQPDSPGMICARCRTQSPLAGILARTTHAGVAKDLVHHLKFERAVAASKPMARAMASLLPSSTRSCLITAVPTASSRVRMRGYDQAAVLARRIARITKASYSPLLARTTQTRQLGASRLQRHMQLKDAFYVPHEARCRDQTVILVDDVMTTGSSLEAAAEALRASGAKRVFGLVFARQE